jgi:membrane-bound lytic murein transglycosylase D
LGLTAPARLAVRGPDRGEKALKTLVTLAALTWALAACAGSPAPGVPTPARGSATAATESGDTTAHDSVAVAASEVTEQAVKVFGDSMPPTPPVPGDALDSAVAPAWDIDVRSYETHQRVEHYVALFTGSARERFVERLERGTRYDALIRSKLRAAGLPEDMTYLALIESSFNPHAYSRAAAVGLWQFMTSTARGMGLRVDWWVDERRDPVRSTDAAIRFLSYLNDQFGSLYLAAAAYNGGPGRVSRGLTKYADQLQGTTGDDIFFALAEKDYLRAETRNYVPQLIAAALVGKDPARYGLVVQPRPSFIYDSVRVGPSIPLAVIARAGDASLADVVDLNPHILRGVTPPRDSFFVRIPVGHAVDVDSALRALPAAERSAYTRVRTKTGDTMVGLARKHGLTAKQLAWYNPKAEVSRKTGRLYAGQTILVPSRDVVSAARDVPDPKIERYGSGRRVHVVKRGESLGLIAKRYRTSVQQIKRLNGLRKDIIFPGQALVVSGSPARRSTRAASKPPSGRAASGRP